MQLLFGALALAIAVMGVGAVAVGCSAPLVDIDAADTPAKQDNQGSTNGGGAKFSPPTAAADAAAASPYRGNPLCYPATGSASSELTTCAPDEAVCLPVDAPAADGGMQGCRIAPSSSGDEVLPRCLDAGPNGTDSASCERGADCAPGFDCVAGEHGTKACRHYCCTGTCKGNLSNESATFCDVQNLVDVQQKAPFCMPLKHCNKLLGTGECNAQESCTVVTESGDTGCLAIGDMKVGESCETAHCQAELACLGQAGARKCFKLCAVGVTECQVGESCVTSAAFKDANFGICQ